MIGGIKGFVTAQFQKQCIVIARESRRDDRSNLVFRLPRQKIVKQYLPRNDEVLL